MSKTSRLRDSRLLAGLILSIPALALSADAARAGDLPFSPTMISDIAERVTPAVVNITTTKLRSMTSIPFTAPPELREFFGAPPDRHEREVGAGSGVVISADGYIVTNNHVIEGADEIKVTFADKREFEAKLIGSDPPSDVALLKIDATKLPNVGFGNSAKLRLGEFVLAIGNPYGVGQTVTMGIVSAKGRTPNIGKVEYEDFIQTDAAINPGNSGGALVNMQGELVGINTAIISKSGGAQGIGFAVPSNMVKPILEQVREHGRVRRGYLGVTIQDLTPELAHAFRLKDTKGVVIGDVVEKGPASRAKIQAEDVILSFNDQPATNASDLRNAIALMKPGSKVRLAILRAEKKLELTVTLDEKAPSAEPEAQAEAEEREPTPMLLAGLTVRDLSRDIRKKFDVPAAVSGVVVSDVEQGSLAQRAGLVRGDVITSVDRQPVRSAADFSRLVRKDAKDVVLRVRHQYGASTFVVLKR
jgi:Do/DeqQ family serine protease